MSTQPNLSADHSVRLTEIIAELQSRLDSFASGIQDDRYVSNENHNSFGLQVDELLAALSRLAGRPPASATPESVDRPRSGVDADRLKETSILLVEDNTVNQMVAVGMLQQFNCSVDVAGNGAEAMRRIQDSDYDLVFMDCQMPVMDGFEAVAKIREYENNTKRRHTPVVALTANALKGDRDRCVTAGMDDYVSKPFTLTDLQQVIERHLKPGTPEPAASETAVAEENEAAPEIPAMPVIDPAVLQSIGELASSDDGALLNRVISVFLETSPGVVDQLQTAMKNGTQSEIVAAAHSLRSCSGSIGAISLVNTCRRIEAQAKAGQHDPSHDHAAQLQAQFERVSIELRRIQGDTAYLQSLMSTS